MHEIIEQKICSIERYTITLIKWILISGITGIIGGIIGSLFHLSVEYATSYRMENRFILYILPFAGLAIVFLYMNIFIQS